MKYVFIQRTGDREKIIELLSQFDQLSKQELVDQYNSAAAVGIVGVHAQALMLIALYNAFNSAFGKSPIAVADYCIISLTGQIELDGTTWRYK